MSRMLAACLAAIVLPFAASASPVYKCESGKASRYQNAPCPKGTKETQVTAPTLAQQINVGDPATGTYTPEASKLRQKVAETISVLATYPVCAQTEAGYAKKHGASFDAWKKRNAMFIARVQSDATLRTYLDSGMALEKKRATEPDERAKQAKECATAIPAALKN